MTELGLARGTIEAAYSLLAAEGAESVTQASPGGGLGAKTAFIRGLLGLSRMRWRLRLRASRGLAASSTPPMPPKRSC
jgi:hypothetical protein